MRKAVRGKARISVSDTAIRCRRRQAGFSLFELLIALTLVIAILALIPAYLSKGISAAELKSSVRQIGSGLQAARSEAISRNSQRVFVVDVDERQFFIGANGAANQLAKTLDLTLKTAESERISDTRGGIRFFPDGSSTGGEVLVASDGRTLKIAVNWVTGKVAIIPVD